METNFCRVYAAVSSVSGHKSFTLLSEYFLRKEKREMGKYELAWLNFDLSCWLSSPLEETAFHT